MKMMMALVVVVVVVVRLYLEAGGVVVLPGADEDPC
jgi:hypothetical protein